MLAAATAPLVLVLAGASAVASSATVEFAFTDPAIVESSGLVARGGLVATVNDSGDTGRVFVVDPRSGDTVGVTTWSSDPEDVEAIAPAADDPDGAVWVGDIGDNAGTRESVTVARVPIGRGERDLGPATYDLVYPGGPQDAETLLVDPDTGRLVVVTKNLFGGDVFIAPERLDPDRPTRMRRIGEAIGVATDGSFFPDGRHVVVRGYAAAVVYAWPGLREVGRFDLPAQEQGEGVAVDEDGTILVSSEGAGSEVLRVRVPRRIDRAMEPPTPPRDEVSAEPRAEDPVDLDPEDERADPVDDASAWPWLLGGLVGLGVVAVLVRSLRPPG